MAMHNAKIKADITLPKGCKEANSNEEINIANSVGTINFNLLSKTPLNINSSEIGETKMVAIKPPITIKYYQNPIRQI